MNHIFDIFSEHSKKALKLAFQLALKTKNKTVDIEHLFFAIAKEKGSIGCEILHQMKIKNELMEKPVSGSVTVEENTAHKPQLSPAVQRAINRATLISSLNAHQYVGTEHMLFGILETNDETINEILKRSRISSAELKNKIKLVFKSTSKFPHISDTLNNLPHRDDEIGLERFDIIPQRKSMLELFSSDLTDKKAQKCIDPVIGREPEIERIVQILCRRTKNNPLLLGDPGVGKTAIVEGLGKAIMLGLAPEVLLNKKILSLDLGMLIAGSSFRGEFEHRLKQVIREVKADQNIILFIDEIHNIVGAGAATGSMDAANILKPSLARGEIRCIGATTMEEYKKYIENDPAFERRFQTVMVQEPTLEKTVEILAGIKIHYEKFHRVSITQDAVDACVKLSHRYFPEKFFPDKAIDLLDEAASSIRVKRGADKIQNEIRRAEKEFEALNDEKKRAVMMEDYDTALSLREQEGLLLGKISLLKKSQNAQKSKLVGTITETDIKEVVSKITRIPVQELNEAERNNVLQLEKKLSQTIIGQDEAVTAVSEYVRRAWAGINDPNRPIASFIFLGPSGVGKTELAKTLSTALFSDPKALVRLDMSEYAESFNISKLIGSPAGYVGYKDATALTDKIKKRPHSIVLFDEIEKAHPQIFHLLLQILEDGHLTDASGKTINFKNTVIIMTSNIGSESFHKKNTLGFGNIAHGDTSASLQSFHETKKSVLDQLKKFFRVEFLNRIDKVVVFSPLSPESLKTIAGLHIQKLTEKLSSKNIGLDIHPSVSRRIAELSHASDTGARAIQKNVQELIENPLAQKILSGAVTPHQKIKIRAQQSNIVIE